MRETWHHATSGLVADVVRYYYENGRPTRVDVAFGDSLTCPTRNDGYTTFALQFSWHGDATTHVKADGSLGGPTGVKVAVYNPWGSTVGFESWSESLRFYYRWNAAWGYLWFSDLGLYYVHGRWYSPELGRLLSLD